MKEISEGKEIFRWQATAGDMASFVGGTMPGDFSPCGVTIRRRETQLMADPVRFYPYIAGLNLPLREVLLVPFFLREKPVGTVWIVSHHETSAFDAEDARLVSSLAQFASAACESLTALANSEMTQRKLEKVGAQLEAALDAGAIGTWSWDVAKDEVSCDTTFNRFFPIENIEAGAQSVNAYLQAIHAEDRDNVSAQIAQAIETLDVYECEYRVRQPDGSHRWLIARGKPLCDDKKNVTHLSGVVLDITARKEAQLDLEKQQRDLWAALPVACYTLDTRGALTFFNEAAALWDRRPVLGDEMWSGAHTLFTLNGTPLPPEQSSVAVAVREQRQTPSQELYVGRADGWRRVVLHTDPIVDSAGAFRGVVIVISDVTEERLARASLEEARDQAIAASRAKDEFLAALSHELRTPLNPVLLLASDAACNHDYPAKVREEFDTVRKNIELEAKLIEDLLDITKITRGVMTLDCAPVDLHAVLKEAAQKVQMDADAKGLVIQWNLGAAQTRVNGDPARLQQVFWNVLKNAVKFTPPGGVVRIESFCASAQNTVAVRIQDSGIGMEAAEISKIFNAFVQGQHANKGGVHRFGGLGLGLAISQKVIELHHGRIEALSDGRGKGSTFKIEMPLTSAEARGNPVQPFPAVPLSPPPRHLHILIVEDNASTRDALTRLLIRRGHHVAAAGSGQEACELVSAQPFDLAICDVGLPDTDGHTLLAKLLVLRPGLVAIAMTGYGTDSDVALSDKAGFLVHLTKPVSVSRLEEAIAQIAAAGVWSRN